MRFSVLTCRYNPIYLNLDNHVGFAGYNANVRAIWDDNQMLVLASHF
jgi:hypothetical protein